MRKLTTRKFLIYLINCNKESFINHVDMTGECLQRGNGSKIFFGDFLWNFWSWIIWNQKCVIWVICYKSLRTTTGLMKHGKTFSDIICERRPVFQCFFWGISPPTSVRGSSINHLVNFLGIFDPRSPSWSLLLNKTYVIKWSFGKPQPPPQLVYGCPLNAKRHIVT